MIRLYNKCQYKCYWAIKNFWITVQYYWKNASKVYSPTQHLLHSTTLLFSANFFIYPHSTSFLPPLSSCFRQMSFSYLWSHGTASLWPQIWVELFKQLMNQSPVHIMYNKEKSINWPNSITPKKGACCHATPNLAVRSKCSNACLSG